MTNEILRVGALAAVLIFSVSVLSFTASVVVQDRYTIFLFIFRSLLSGCSLAQQTVVVLRLSADEWNLE